MQLVVLALRCGDELCKLVTHKDDHFRTSNPKQPVLLFGFSFINEQRRYFIKFE